MIWWAGCNRWINQGRNEYEPIGTATSMHDCDDCEHIPYCKLKKETDVWEWNEEIEIQMDADWKILVEIEKKSGGIKCQNTQ